MNLILLLSALLSALSGTGGARAAQAPTALSRSSDIVATAVKAAAAVRHQVASRPVQPVAAPVHAMVMALPDFALSDAIPAFASRRRE